MMSYKEHINRKLMLINDDEGFRMRFKSALEATGNISLVATSDAKNAVTLAKTICPDLILLDLFMPKLHNLPVSIDLSRDNQTRDIPIAYLSSLANAEEATKINREPGPLFVLSKCAADGELIECIEEIIQLSSKIIGKRNLCDIREGSLRLPTAIMRPADFITCLLRKLTCYLIEAMWLLCG